MFFKQVMVDFISNSVVYYNETKVSVVKEERSKEAQCCLRVTDKDVCFFRARPMQGGDDLVAYTMGKKTDAPDHSEIQLHRIKPQEHFIEAQVQEGDTLQAIALRFYCSVSLTQ